jgi:hypothetical protein
MTSIDWKSTYNCRKTMRSTIISDNLAYEVGGIDHAASAEKMTV